MTSTGVVAPEGEDDEEEVEVCKVYIVVSIIV